MYDSLFIYQYLNQGYRDCLLVRELPSLKFRYFYLFERTKNNSFRVVTPNSDRLRHNNTMGSCGLNLRDGIDNDVVIIEKRTFGVLHTKSYRFTDSEVKDLLQNKEHRGKFVYTFTEFYNKCLNFEHAFEYLVPKFGENYIVEVEGLCIRKKCTASESCLVIEFRNSDCPERFLVIRNFDYTLNINGFSTSVHFRTWGFGGLVLADFYYEPNEESYKVSINNQVWLGIQLDGTIYHYDTNEKIGKLANLQEVFMG